MAIRILSIDGGGLRGLFPLWVLQEIQQLTGRSAFDYFDFFTGTSTGAIIACGLNVPRGGLSRTPKFEVKDLISLYEKESETIFPFGSPLKEWWKDQFFSYVKSPKYSNQGLRGVLQNYFGENRIKDCLKPIMVPTYCIQTMEPLWFRSRIVYEDPSIGITPVMAESHDIRLQDVLMAATAAPTFLPAHPLHFGLDEMGQPKARLCIDGGIYQNNPSASALVEFLKNNQVYSQKYKSPIGGLEDIFILSLGTGNYTEPLNERRSLKEGGKLDWAIPAIEIAMWGNAQAVDYQISEWLRFSEGKQARNYLRINFRLDNEELSEMDNSSPQIREKWKSVFQKQFHDNLKLKSQLYGFLNASGSE